jgi:hypothetical protein
MAAFTPGPWTVCHSAYNRETVGFSITASPHGSCAPICRSPALSKPARPPQEIEANARLISAAPELLAALKDVLRIARAASIGVTGNAKRIAAAEAAISKAEGR